MSNQAGIPYAAKAIITHEFDTDHLNIWITFRFCMDVTTKPANMLWIAKLDGITKAVTASAWQDDFTMLLTIDAIALIPTRVTLQYNGPDENLTTVWGKQWEPWGPILSADGSLLPYGNLDGFEIAWTQAAAQDVFYPILDAGIVNNAENKMTFQNLGEYKIAVSGIYTISWFATVEVSIANKHVLGGISLNSAIATAGRTHHEFARANEEAGLSGVAILNLIVDDTVGVGVYTTDAGNPTLTVDHLGLTIHEIGIT